MHFYTWASTGGNIYYAILNGGPAGYLFNYIVVLLGVIVQSACFAELASIMPIAGAQYYWTYHWAPPSCREFLTWIQGWTTWLGYLSILATIVNSIGFSIGALINMFNPDYEVGGWRSVLYVMAVMLIYTVLNTWTFKLVPAMELILGIVNIATFFFVIVAVWVLSPRNSPDVFVTFAKFSGYENDFVSWSVGMLPQIYMFVGIEGVIHMGEETKDPKRTVPFAMFWSIVVNGVMGLFSLMTWLICMPPTEDMVNAIHPFYYLLWTSLGSPALFLAITILFLAGSFACGLSAYASCSRLTWAWARDGGIPAYFAYVDSKSRVPVRAVVLTCTVILLLNLFNLGTDSLTALGAITSLPSLALYNSYAIVFSVTLYTRLTTGLPHREWSLGRAGLAMNIAALVFTVYCMIWLPFPTKVPVTAYSMNYSGPVFLVVMLGAMGAWFVWAKRNWGGPNKALAEHVVREFESS
ncbi:amino acid/polyamine transporter I [Microdochium trichocladiopsis]|uniref:Amino acid/polyamine transporter I n=1 Tax=Microdochium trichocladiopsis TaxID=1682393 RepID=A0A9P9BRZ2_9PEZI|nr:amino acid/polyamine transporter I [Microdochium trichocladiopsis]KAH7037360.1 amino acid/polyamine transporter I [Microdochium trichocladiopsis]